MMTRLWKVGSVFLITALLLSGCSGGDEQLKNEGDKGIKVDTQESTTIRAVYLKNDFGNDLFVDLENDSPFTAVIPDDIVDENDESLTEDELNSGDVFLVYGDGIMLESYPGQYPGVTKMARQERVNQEYIDKYQELFEQICPEPDRTQVPDLSVSYRQPDAMVTAMVSRGGYQWKVEKQGNEAEETIADSSHILEWGEELTEVTMTENAEFTLIFSYEPESVEVKRWTEEERREPGTSDPFPEGESVKVTKGEEGFSFDGESGNVYQIVGKWEEGEVEFGFFTTKR